VIEPVSDNVAKAVGLPRPTGALIQGITAGSPAEKAGLRQGDIVLAVDGEEVISVNDLQTKIARHYPGETVTITIFRDRKEWQVEIELGEAPAPQQPVSQLRPDKKEKHEYLGISLRELSGEEKSELNIQQGLLIEKVAAGSPAATAGLFPMSILLSIDETPLSTVAEFEKIIAQAQPGEFLKFKMKSVRSPGEDDSRILFVEIP
jgi:serine protease Do